MINQDELIQETIDFEGRYHEEMYITIAECKQIMAALEQRLVKNLPIPDVSKMLPTRSEIDTEIKRLTDLGMNKEGYTATFSWEQGVYWIMNEIEERKG